MRHAALEASTASCGSHGLAHLNGEAAAHGVATAVAQAFASVLGNCETEGKGFACVNNVGWIETVSIATAEAVRHPCYISFPPQQFLSEPVPRVCILYTLTHASGC